MATVYSIKVELCSAFCRYSNQEMNDIITKLLKDYQNDETGQKFGSIFVDSKIMV